MDLIFLFKVVNGLIDCSELLQLIDIHIPSLKTRLASTFAKHHHLTVYEYHSTVPRLMRLGNAPQLDFFGLNFPVFKKRPFSFVTDLIHFNAGLETPLLSFSFFVHSCYFCVVLFIVYVQYSSKYLALNFVHGC
jgi:hypothetical protein